MKPLALVFVAAVDRRVLPALALAPRFSDGDVRAVHVAFDVAASNRLARDWMDLNITWPPLHIEEPTAPTLALTVRDLVLRELRGRDRVTVLIPELTINRWWQPLLHRGTGRAIAWSLADLDGVTTVVLPVAVSLPQRPHRDTSRPTLRRA